MNDTSLIEWLRQDLAGLGLSPSEEALAALEDDAKRVITVYLNKAPRLRPSHLANEIKALAGHLEKAARSAERIGDQGLRMIIAASGIGHEPEPSDMREHVVYLRRMAAGSRQAVQTARDESRSTLDHHGGRTPDYNLRNLVAHLVVAFQEILGVRPLHTTNPETGLVERGAAFVKKALKQYAPERTFEERHIDDLVRWALSARDLAYFEPPPMPDEPGV